MTTPYDDMVHYIANGYWEWSGGAGYLPRWEQTNLSVNVEGLEQNDRDLVDAALRLWSDYTPFQFSYTTGTASLTFQNYGTGDAYADIDLVPGTNRIASVFINVDYDWGGGQTAGINSYRFQTFIHEIGHGLGLGHAGPYNGTAVFDPATHFSTDSWQTSVMSYFSQGENSYVAPASHAYAITPQIADILAIQSLYGGGSAVRGGNTVYGVGNNTGHASFGEFGNFNFPTVTIYDDGGLDTLNYTGTHLAQTINLNAGTFSSVYGELNNLIIAYGTQIENANGGSGVDYIYGNALANTIYGNDSGDHIWGEQGNDGIDGGSGVDVIFGGDGADLIRGGADGDIITGGNAVTSAIDEDFLYGDGGDDRIVGGADADYIDGGDDVDTVSYTDHGIETGKAPFAVKVDLTEGKSYQGIEGSGSWEQQDTLVSI